MEFKHKIYLMTYDDDKLITSFEGDITSAEYNEIMKALLRQVVFGDVQRKVLPIKKLEEKDIHNDNVSPDAKSKG